MLRIPGKTQQMPNYSGMAPGHGWRMLCENVYENGHGNVREIVREILREICVKFA